MEFTERVELKRIAFLKTLNITDIKSLCPHLKNDTMRHKQLDLLKSFCETNIKTKGVTKRIYKYSEDTVQSFGGRLYSSGGVQGLPKKFRGFLMKHTTDIDMKNAHPTILKYLCKQNNIRCPMLSEYVSDRDGVLENMEMDREEAKELYLKALNDNKLNPKCKNKIFRAFDAEMKTIQTEFFGMEQYETIRDSVPVEKRHNWMGSHLNRIICSVENEILQHIIHILNSKGIDIEVLMFDGLMVTGDYYADDALLATLTEGVAQKFPQLQMEFAYKPHNNDIVIPDDFTDDTCEIDGCYAQVKEEFEKTHFKVTEQSSFYTLYPDGTINQRKRSDFKVAYEQLKYNEFTEKGVKMCAFIDRWFVDKDMREYAHADVYPPDVECPSDTFNLWIPFAMELIPLGEPTPNETELIRKHILILCNNEVKMAEYIEKWIAQMIQYPSVKTVMPTFISKQGAGKGTLMKLFQRMFGERKVMNEITTPSRDVWGNFNGMMGQAFLVNIDELSGRDSREAEGTLKSLIKSDTITINQKGVNSVTIKSYARFICTTNNADPVSVTKDDRRNCVIRTSDELCKNVEYFTKMYALLSNTNVVRNVYEYFKTLPCPKNFDELPIPQSEYQQTMVELSITPIEQWIREYAMYSSGITKMTSNECFLKFEQWKIDNKIQFETNTIKFGIMRARLGIDGVESIKGTGGLRLVQFDSDKIRAHCGI